MTLTPPTSACLKILFVGDMHLGVLPGHLPMEVVQDRRLDPHQLSPAAAWRRVVDAAREHQVHAVALAGDLVDGRNDLFEAYGPLEAGFRDLAAAGIPAIAVAGNHDTTVLPRLARLLDGLHLLGPVGTWTTHDVAGPDGLVARLAGWSFPRAHVETSPLTAAPPPADPRIPTLGLLHADLDQTTSRYAPVSTAELRRAGYRGWFLGHTHRPDAPRADGHPFYLGSVVGLHPGETGEHGPVLVEMDAGGELRARRLPLAPLRWEHLDVPVAENQEPSPEELLAQILEAVQSHGKRLGPSLEQTLAVGFRVRLTGTTAHASLWRQALERLRAESPSLVVESGSTVLFVDRIEEDLRQPLDLEDLARFPDPAGLLARRILILEGKAETVPGVEDTDAEQQRLLSRGQEAIAAMEQQGAFRGLESAPEGEEIARRLAATGRRALEEILASKEVGHAAG